MLIKVTCDSSADLTKEQYKDNNISVIPFTVTMGDKDYLDGVNIFSNDIFKFVSENKTLPKTAAINEYQYEEFFKNEIKGYDALIHFSISSKISSTCGFATLAANIIDNCFVIDSLSLSSGLGIQVLYACELIKQGLSAKEVVEKVNNRRKYVQISFATFKLDYLHKGGRCSSLQLLGSNLLKIRPSIALIDGKMGMHKKYFGKMEKVVENYLLDTFKEFNTPDNSFAFLTYSSATDEILNIARTTIENNSNFKKVVESFASSTVTSHCGENTIGIIYYNDGKNN